MTLPLVLHRAFRRAAMLFPDRWKLPAIARIDQWQGVEPESTQLALIGPCRGIAIDVGANYGLYSYALSKLYRKVVAFEPNRDAMALLAAWKSPRIMLEYCALSSTAGRSNLHIPRKRGVELSGWASLYADNFPGVESMRSVEVELRTLDSFHFLDVGFIKIDAEGHELEVLQGARETIMTSMPHLLVEIRRNDATVHELLKSWGYRGCTLADIAGTSGSPANFVFRPLQSAPSLAS
jgi:FkbM family methyltransferase